MMMQRAHQEHALVISELTTAHLDDDRKRLHNVDRPKRQKQPRIARNEG